MDMAAADFVSNPTIKVSMGTKIPPPPTPPTVPHADPRNPIIVASTILQLNSSGYHRRIEKQENYYYYY